MTLKSALSLRGVVVLSLTLFLTSVFALGFILIPPPSFSPLPKPQSTGSLSIFSSPSQVPPGESWVLLGSFEALPLDLSIQPLSENVTVLETQRISDKAFGVRLQVPAGVIGKLLRVSSASAQAQAEPELYLGGILPPLVADANFKDADFLDGHLIVNGPDFIYGYIKTSQSPLSALRIHNRQNGRWYRHEYAIEKTRQAAEPKAIVGPEFKETDPLETLPDTDGDQVFDFEEEPFTKDPVPEQIGIELVPGTNLLDIVAVDEAGNASWKTISVYTTYLGE